MKKRFFFLIVTCFLIYMLTHPQDSLLGAAQGLSLWYHHVLPVLLPFSIVSNIIVDTCLFEGFFFRIHKPFTKLLGLSANGIYPLAAGFLLGFPMGSKISADLWHRGKLSQTEFQLLSSIANNISPAFISGFLIYEALQSPEWTFRIFFILYAPPLILGSILLRKNARRKTSGANMNLSKKTASRSQINFKIIDAAVMNGLTTITRLGCYIMLFGIIAQAVIKLPFSNKILHAILIGITEVTNGIQAVSSLSLSFEGKLLLLSVITQFGGCCGLMQTISLTKDTPFSTGFYLKFKGICVLFSALLVFVCILYSNC